MQIHMPEDVKYIIETLSDHGFEAFAVGGCVRDAVLGREPHDWDITTSARPEQVKSIFHHTIDTGIEHGTVTVMKNHIGYEVTTYRIDGEYEDSRHPKEVTFTSRLVDDLKRRDFTINAMAYNDTEGLVDVFEGIADLDRKVIRCVGDPKERFGEDALRMLRAVRFAAQLGFEIDNNTRAAILELAPTIRKVSAERIQTEMIKMLTSDHPEEIRTAWELGLTAIFFPEFDLMMETPQNTKYHCYNVGEHTIHAMMNIPADKVLRLSMLLHDVGKPATRTTDEKGQDHFYGHQELGAKMADTILRRWKLDNDTIHACCNLVYCHDLRPDLTGKSIRRLINQAGAENMEALLLVKHADVAGQSAYSQEINKPYLERMEAMYRETMQQNQCVQKKDMAIGGRDLIAIGIRPGKEMGKILDDLFQRILEDPAENEKEHLIQVVKEEYLS